MWWRKGTMVEQVRQLPSKNYSQVIEISVPVRFYWADGNFDGIEMGPFSDKLTQLEELFCLRILTELSDLMDLAHGCEVEK